ncbi:MAG: hypothetical protein P9L97_08945 [Candidatus Tenebribacter davisii]|nr:hypothetical protein [Candidatus Tenebribacter davisii]
MTKEYITLQEYDERHTWPTIHGLRHLIRNIETNGLGETDIIARVGRRILIDEKGFMEWVGKRRK